MRVRPKKGEVTQNDTVASRWGYATGEREASVPALHTEMSALTHKGLTKRLYSLPEAAMYLGRSTWSVRRLIWGGELPAVRAGGRVHVDVQDMDDFINKNKVQECPV